MLDIHNTNYLYKIHNVYVVRTFMPFPLKENNCYLAESNDGWIIIDTGVNTETNKIIWQNVLNHIGISFKNIKRIYITHYHHDHLGLAGWIQHHSGAEVFLSSTDIEMLTTYVDDTNYFNTVKDVCKNAGWDEQVIKNLSDDIRYIDPLIKPLPTITPIDKIEYISIENDTYFLKPFPGHSDGHIIFYSPDSKMLISGDNLIKDAILHLTDWPHTNLEDHLSAYLKSLEKIAKLDIKKVLPGHGAVFSNYNEKIAMIKAHHYKRKNKVYNSLSNPMSAWELTKKIFQDNPYIHIKRLLIAETIAYLNTLYNEGLVDYSDDRGVCVYFKKNN